MGEACAEALLPLQNGTTAAQGERPQRARKRLSLMSASWHFQSRRELTICSNGPQWFSPQL